MIMLFKSSKGLKGRSLVEITMFIDSFCTEHNQNSFSFTRDQASRFAKQVANDFNPIHDEDSKRFCVPGDLLFAKLLCQRGVSSSLKVSFHNMVSDGVVLSLNESGQQLALVDTQGREYLRLQEQGERIENPQVIESLIRGYVSFSGENFPHLLVPLMRQHGMMVNPARPLVIYESMSLTLNTTTLVAPELESVGSDLEISGRRGNVTLNFHLRDQGEIVGSGVKTMVLSSLREYEESGINDMIEEYNNRRSRFAA